MHRKKWVALLLVLLLTTGLFTGCSPAEKGYYDLVKEASNQKMFEQTGSIELNLDQLPANTFEGENVFTEAVVKNAIANHKLNFLGKANMNQGEFQYDLSIVDKKTGAKIELISLIGKADVLYIKVDQMVRYLKEFGDAEDNQKLDQLFGDTEYVSLSIRDLEEIMPPGNPPIGLKNNYLQDSSRQQMIWLRLFDGLIDKVYDQYQPGLVTKTNNRYALTLRAADSIEVAKPLAVYTIKNIDKLGLSLKSFLSSLTPNELAVLGLTPEMKEGALQGIGTMVAEINQNRDQYLTIIEEIDVSSDELKQLVNDSELVTTFEKKDARTYDTFTRMHVHVTPEGPAEVLNFTLNMQQTQKGVGSVQIDVPNGKVISFKDLQNRMPKQMKVNVDHGRYFMDKGFSNTSGTIDVRLIDDHAYLPLRQIAESMEEKVGWDQELRQAYVERNGKRHMFTEMILDDKAFVKIRDLGNIGYRVAWDDSTRTITIEQ
ncbi:MAG: copper amine oxidase N-terminal domain-containing protein [Syntrophomonadaceae bacterium]|nr:copper amine oxidase N-terminal domain-containing protein [Syntrophomonadaceae bacterium]